MTPQAMSTPNQALQGEFGREWTASKPPCAPSRQELEGKAPGAALSPALRLAWLPIALHILLAIVFYWRANPSVLGYREVGAALNFICVMGASLFVAALAARSFLARPSMSILFMGGGALTLGLAGLLTAGLMWRTTNVNDWATIYRGSAFLGAAWHFVGALFDLWAPHKRVRSPWLSFAMCYLGAAAAVGILMALI